MDGKSGESTEGEDVLGAKEGETGSWIRMMERSRELIPETR